MDISLIFVIVIMFYFCVIFPLQMRRYIMIRGQRQNTQRPQTRNAPAYARSVLRRNNDTSSREQSDNHIVFSVSQHSSPSCTESQSDEATEAARHLEAEHRQQIIEIQREIEQQAVRRREESSDPNAPHLPPRIINSSTVRNPVAEYSQQIIEVQREIERQAIQRREEQRSAANPHMPPRLINISIILASCKTIWKSLKDAVRYRKNKMAKVAEGADESQDDYDMDSNWELSDCLSFLMDAPAPKHPQTLRRLLPTASSNIPTSVHTKMTMGCNDDDTSASETSFSRTAPQKQAEDDPLFVESMVNMANSIREIAKGMMGKQDRQEKTSLKFDYIWRNLDTFFARLPPEDVDALNLEFVQMAYERLKKVQSSQ